MSGGDSQAPAPEAKTKPAGASPFAGRWALVTGASAGIGAALARELAARGAHLVLTARRRQRLEALALELEERHGVHTRTVAADLNDRAAVPALHEATEGAGIAIDILVNNAGYGQYGEFLGGDLEAALGMVEVNCRAVLQLTGLLLPRMVDRRRGWVMIVASTASFQPVPYMAAYAATKAFDRYLAEALAAEVGRHGVRVSALCPGPTESEFGQVAGSPDWSRRSQPAAEVARRGLDALARGRPAVIPPLSGRLMTSAQRVFPRRTVTAAIERMFRPRRPRAGG
jgi:short-subunit dehydrogenase